MAADEAMLDAAVQQNSTSLRFYQWQQPMLSLGYFQCHADRGCHPRSESLPLVRRLSGGGALLHDKELTYSFALAASHPLAAQSRSLYRRTHLALVDALQEFGIHAHLHSAGNKQEESGIDRCADATVGGASDQPFLCFQRFCPEDVLLPGSDGHTTAKIVGSAQRRRRGAILQHGSILLATSPIASELPGIRELTGVDLAADELVKAISERLAESLVLDLLPNKRLASSDRQIANLQMSKYNQTVWNERR